jgi:putative endonuclease
MYYVYVIVSNDNQKYIGYTNNLKRRMEEHNSGKNKSTKGKIWELVYYEAYRSKEDAFERERKLKQRGRGKQILYERIKRSIEGV